MHRANVGTRETSKRITFARALVGVVPPLLATLLAACQGDTLYDSGPKDMPGPAIAVVAPTPGIVVAPGKTFRLQVQASDSLGISSLQVDFSGAATGTVRRDYTPAQDFVAIDTVVTVPPGATGQVKVEATARNRAGVVARAGNVAVTVGTDQVPPAVTLLVDSMPARMELTDSVRVRVRAVENPGGAGVALISATVLQVTSTGQIIQRIQPTIAVLDTATIRVSFAAPARADSLPADRYFEIYGFAQDSAGNCAAATPAGNSLPCRKLSLDGEDLTIAEPRATALPTKVVAGRSFGLESGSVIADMYPDTLRGRLYIANYGQSRIDVLDLRAQQLLPIKVLAGAHPWGLATNITDDTLIVANSGGTNISRIALDGNLTEVTQDRIRTQTADFFAVKYDLRDTVLSTGVRDTIFVINITLEDFSDRPQFIAQDSHRRLVYSTLPTPGATLGTIRVLEKQPGWAEAESRLAVLPNAPDTLLPTFEKPEEFGLVNIDSLRAIDHPIDATNRIPIVRIYDHVPGFPERVIVGYGGFGEALAQLRAQGSDWHITDFDKRLLSFSDTSFVAASGNRRFVAFGEGAAPNGRIVIWDADSVTFSNGIRMIDLVGNTGENLRSVDLSSNGDLGVARGLRGAYYFTRDLRLQGSRELPATPVGGSGAVLDRRSYDMPAYGPYPGYDPSRLSYVATDKNTIKIYDTVHFAERGEIAIRDNVVGPLRVSLPLRGCSGSNCPIAKLYGATGNGTLVVVDVLPSDIKQ
ncbi:MAG: hypothetical protein IRZ00_08410 [Gemmatimonadetes bacterium]|nr:hypothetical protein [Gemmatimonadota bacterium]